jgi:hypothetical protein
MIENTSEQWIAAGELIRKRKQEPFFRIGIQGALDNGDFLCAVLFRDTKDVFQTGLYASEEHLKKFKELKLMEEL